MRVLTLPSLSLALSAQSAILTVSDALQNSNSCPTIKLRSRETGLLAIPERESSPIAPRSLEALVRPCPKFDYRVAFRHKCYSTGNSLKLEGSVQNRILTVL